jgi:ATP-binding cassette subfamily B (MDR/TAP) protein 1
MAFKYASGWDILLFVSGILAAIIFGAAMPMFSVIFGEMVDGVGGLQSFEELGTSALYMVYVGIGTLFVCFLQITGLSVFSDSIS